MFTSYHLFLEQGSESQPISIGLRDVNEYIRYIWMINISVPQKYPDIFFIKDLPQVVAFLTRSPIGTYTQTDIETSLRLSDKKYYLKNNILMSCYVKLALSPKPSKPFHQKRP